MGDALSPHAVPAVRQTTLVGLVVLLLCILGTAIAPLCGVCRGWAYYHKKHYSFGSDLQIWAGYVKGTDTVTLRLHSISPDLFPSHHMLKEVSMSGQVWGGIEAALLCLSIITDVALLAVALQLLLAPSRKLLAEVSPDRIMTYLWFTALISSIVLFLSAVVMFVLLGIGVSRRTKHHLGHKYIPWPHWAWWLAVINSWLWLAVALLARRERRRGHPGGVASVATPSDGEQAKLSVAPHSGEGTWPTSAC